MRCVSLSIFLIIAFLVGGVAVACAEGKAITIADAVRSAVEQATDVTLQRETVEQKKGTKQEEEGTFDPELSVDTSFERATYPLSYYYRAEYSRASQPSQTTSTTISLEKTTQEGITFGPKIELDRLHQIWYLNTTTNRSTMSFDVTVPLLKNWGRDSTGADLKAAEIDLDSAMMDLTHTASTSALTVTKSYWEALAARNKLGIYLEIEKNAQDMYDATKQLVDKNEAPAVRLETLMADLDARTAERISQEQALVAAQYQLALDMGIDIDSTTALPMPADNFPQQLYELASQKELLDYALNARMDLISQRRQVDYYQVYVKKYNNQLLPELDFTGSVGLQGLSEDRNSNAYLKGAYSRTYGPNYSVGLDLSYALGNNAAEGTLKQYEALLAQQKANMRETKRTILSDVTVQYKAYISSLQQLKRQADAVDRYRESLNKWQVGFMYGMQTLNDIISMRNYYRDSSLSYVDMQLAHAEALASLRYACGLLVVAEGRSIQVNPDYFYTPPTSPLKMPEAAEAANEGTGDNHE